MSAHQYPFIDVAVHERVRLPFARGEAVVLFSTDMKSVLWANGRGAALFGYASIYDFLDAPTPVDVVFRQLAAAARQLPHKGLGRDLLLRIGSGFRGLPVSAHIERIALAPWQDAILFSTPVAQKDESAAARAASMLAGFDDPDTHMAVLDGEGAIVAASPGFAGLGISEDARRRMIETARRESDGLVKRPIPTGKGLLPAALGRVSLEPALNLLFAVETILGHLDADQEEIAASPTGTQDEDTAGQLAEATAVIAAEPPAPTTSQSAEEALLEGAISISSPEPEGVSSSAQSIEAQTAPDAQADSASAADDESIEVAAEPQSAQPPAAIESEETPFVFNPAARPVRFVWKIDADGIFSEISEEFAQAVGPRAAAVTGQPFVDVAHRFDFDTDGTITELLRRRDTWSGKTIHWPVEGTNLVVPVDLAALPTYSRDREFDGFRGFGIVRTTDAVEDSHGRGLKLAEPAQTIERESVATGSEIGAPADTTTIDVEALPEAEEQDGHEAAVTPPSLLDELLAEEEADGPPEASEASPESLLSGHGTPEPEDEFRGERPALRLVETRGRRHSEKIVQLDDRRGHSGTLSSGEQAAFREIARQLGESFGKRKPEDKPAASSEAETQPLVESESTAPLSIERKDDDLVGGARLDDETGAATSVSSAGKTVDDQDEMPGLEVGEHANDISPKPATITPPRTAMDYGLTASMVDTLPVALLIHAGDRLIHANPEFLTLTGFFSLAELERAGGLDVLLDQPESEDGEHSGTMLLRHADGESTLPVNARLQSVRWEDGTALMMAILPTAAAKRSTDASAKAIEPLTQSSDHDEMEALRDEATELRSILETATDGVVIVGHEGEIRSINRSASALFNYDDDEIRGRPFAMLFAHESQRAVLDYLAGLSGHGVASVLNDGREVIGREASGGFIPLFMTMGRLSSTSGFCAVIRDITQWKRTEEELRNAKRAAETANAHKSEFLARVSHEIRTPLNAIIGFSDMMASERFGPIGHPRYVEYANDIGRSGRHVLDIVNDLLDISKIEAGEMELDFTAVGLNETVSEAVSLVQPQANGQRVIIRTSLSTAVPPVVADLRSIKQIALNILSNAIRFTPSGGQIVVSTSYETNGSVVLRIRDTGVGMTRSELEQAMKPFRQVTTGPRKRGDGTGLGLPLTKAMVDANRANFSISSSPNEGTLVEVTFPSPRVLAV
ncbi:PAS domain S-box protein [Rhizobium sp. ARZ01]|uniref:ATP-binding protein n=1 Tax=Rhizobium sp. ARZ01 TaxID=2769313 RepID=UPI00177DC7DA|nr:ATP-binding protein [Rhizobium sp. ARZ01]MBD9373807.1 PAS domain S-box protein [Rhizobium sp. ARZ01]